MWTMLPVNLGLAVVPGAITWIDPDIVGMDEKIAGISNQAVEDATGHEWEFRVTLLDDANGTDVDHQERVQVLANGDERSTMRSHWKRVIADIEAQAIRSVN